jgi:plastocyanin
LKRILKPIFLIAIAVVAMILLVVLSYDGAKEITIVTVDESGFGNACAVMNGGTGCYTPSIVTVNIGDVVTMTNTDPKAPHTFTSGTVNGYSPSPDGTFDSGVLMSGDAFEWTPENAGEQPYYCMLHTWMQGTIVVQK